MLGKEVSLLTVREQAKRFGSCWLCDGAGSRVAVLLAPQGIGSPAPTQPNAWRRGDFFFSVSAISPTISSEMNENNQMKNTKPEPDL